MLVATLLAVYVGTACALIPVIIDTDVGSDFDDSAAIAMAVQGSDTWDVKLILTATDDTTARAKIVAQYLQAVGRTYIPIGVGVKNDNHTAHCLFGWSEGYDLSKYPGTVYEDGVGAAIDIIKAATQEVLIVAIAPATNFPSLMNRYPDVVNKASIWAMAGSINIGYNNSTKPAAEYNVHTCPGCMQQVFAGAWDITITPLDTCGEIHLHGAAYNAWVQAPSPPATTLAQCYLYWTANGWWNPGSGDMTDTWYDTVAMYLTLPPPSRLNFEKMPIAITDSGFTVVQKGAKVVNVALTWQTGGLAAFELWEGQVIAGTVKVDGKGP